MVIRCYLLNRLHFLTPLRFSKCASAHMKVSPTDRAHQDEPNHTTFINARPNPATKKRARSPKNTLFQNAYKYQRGPYGDSNASHPIALYGGYSTTHLQI